MTAALQLYPARPLVLRMRVPGSPDPSPRLVGARCSRCQQPNPCRYGPNGHPHCPDCRDGAA